MNSLEQIPEEKENQDFLKRIPQAAILPKKNVLSNSKISAASNFNSVNYSSKKPVANENVQKVLSPTNLNCQVKLNSKSKSQTFSVKPLRLMTQVTAPEPISIEELEDQLETLVAHQKQCQSESKYVEAEMAKQRVKELKVLLEKRTKEDLKTRHVKEVTGIERAYLDEMDQFNLFWDKKILEYEDTTAKVQKEVLQKQELEMNNFIGDLDKSLELRPKDNTEILNLRKVEAELAKNEDYMQAYAIKQKIAFVEKEELEKHSFERSKRMKNLISQLKNKHQTELLALQQRVQAGKDEQVKLRSIEFERLLQKFTIAKKDLQLTQTNEVNQYSKSVKMGSVLQASKMVNQSQMSNQSFQKNLAIIKKPNDF